jgi:hypothetical protein
MLEIKNIDKIKNKVIGSTGYYVDKIEPVELSFSNEPSSHFYHIELANQKKYIIVRLNRDKIEDKMGLANCNWYKLSCVREGVTKKYYISGIALKDMNRLLESIKIVGID